MQAIGTYEAQQRAKAIALKQKFYGRKVVNIARQPPLPEWRMEPTWFDQHVIDYGEATAFRRTIQAFSLKTDIKIAHCVEIASAPENARRTMIVIANEVLARYPGYTMDDVRTKRRNDFIVRLKHEIIRAICNERKDLSYPAIGRFMNMDHTSVLSAAGRLKRKPSTWIENEQQRQNLDHP